VKILVTGTDGYIGAILAPFLAVNGHDVLGVDTGFYKAAWLYSHGQEAPRTLCKDIRHIERADLDGVGAVVHMAELANDPLGELAPTITYEINHAGSLRLARLAKAAGVKRFVYTSSCSVYGVAENDVVDESSIVNPQTAYAKCKVLVERDLQEMADDNFSPVFLRNATVYGASPRLRFDLVVNNLCGVAWTRKEIAMTSDGTPWRPLVHVNDVCQAIAQVLEQPLAAIHNQILNVGDSHSNYQIRNIAEIIGTVFPGCKVSFGKPGADNRSYRVNFDKIRAVLPQFNCHWTVEDGARQLRELFELTGLTSEDFLSRRYTRLLQLQHLIETDQIDAHYFWKRTDSLADAKPHGAELAR
jgi:nucleoside-diphosphate-sugar epimerase